MATPQVFWLQYICKYLYRKGPPGKRLESYVSSQKTTGIKGFKVCFISHSWTYRKMIKAHVLRAGLSENLYANKNVTDKTKRGFLRF